LSRRYEDRLLDYLKNYLEVGSKVKRILSSIDPKVRVYIFGSVVKGYTTALSDIDILVVTENIDMKYEMMMRVYREVEAPVELHITTPEKFSSWYKRFISPNEIIEVKSENQEKEV
jgi:predicted nucleotidyltransferase